VPSHRLRVHWRRRAGPSVCSRPWRLLAGRWHRAGRRLPRQAGRVGRGGPPDPSVAQQGKAQGAGGSSPVPAGELLTLRLALLAGFADQLVVHPLDRLRPSRPGDPGPAVFLLVIGASSMIGNYMLSCCSIYSPAGIPGGRGAEPGASAPRPNVRNPPQGVLTFSALTSVSGLRLSRDGVSEA